MELSALCGLWCKFRATFYGYRLIALLLLLGQPFHLLVHILSIIFWMLGFCPPGLAPFSASAKLSIYLASKVFGCPTVTMIIGDIDLPWARCQRVLS
jgi:hypothetical protein